MSLPLNSSVTSVLLLQLQPIIKMENQIFPSNIYIIQLQVQNFQRNGERLIDLQSIIELEHGKRHHTLVCLMIMLSNRFGKIGQIKEKAVKFNWLYIPNNAVQL